MPGSVAVGPRGERVGKGGGFSDLEWGLLSEVETVGASTVAATTVHDLRLRTSMLPVLPHDVPLDLVETPTQLVRPPRALGRPRGNLPEELTAATRYEVDWLPKWVSARASRR